MELQAPQEKLMFKRGALSKIFLDCLCYVLLFNESKTPSNCFLSLQSYLQKIAGIKPKTETGWKAIVKESTGIEKDFQVGPGFFEVNQDQAVFLTQTCQSGA
jgi:hypothetical protein